MTKPRRPNAAERYIALHRGAEGDLAFYQALANDCTSVLELGCGDARVLSTLDCPRRVGLDLDPELLQLARERCDDDVELIEGDMCTFDFDERFELILIPYSGLLCVLSAEAQRSVIERAHRHLEKGGRLVIDGYFADEMHDESEDGQDDEEVVAEVELFGVPYIISEQSTLDRAAQRIDARYRWKSPAFEVIDLLPQRYLLVDELSVMLRDAGFEMAQLFDRYDESSPRERLIAIAS